MIGKPDWRRITGADDPQKARLRPLSAANSEPEVKPEMSLHTAPELIVGTLRVMPVSLDAFDGGVVARLSGPGLLSVLDAAFAGDAAIQLWSSGTLPRAMMVTEIAMQGGSTLVTLEDAPAPLRLN
ncbi:MAG TPA: hypothetical protein DEF16_00500 [Gemmobacter sp.]|nr:hypothetical protein [Gemmobacter sp.]HBU13490.1 hypothetical protein [Gemmobacter sp.]